MKTMKATQDQMDRANEWTAEHYPEAEGAEYETHLADALADIIAVDVEADHQGW